MTTWCWQSHPDHGMRRLRWCSSTTLCCLLHLATRTDLESNGRPSKRCTQRVRGTLMLATGSTRCTLNIVALPVRSCLAWTQVLSAPLTNSNWNFGPRVDNTPLFRSRLSSAVPFQSLSPQWCLGGFVFSSVARVTHRASRVTDHRFG